MNAWDKSPLLWFVGELGAVLTAYYMSRQVFMVFFGKARWDEARPAAADAGAGTRAASPSAPP